MLVGVLIPIDDLTIFLLLQDKKDCVKMSLSVQNTKTIKKIKNENENYIKNYGCLLHITILKNYKSNMV